MKYSVTIDAGHGGWDTGATFSGIAEKDRNLVVAMAVGLRLKQKGVKVFFTRTTDKSLSIQERIDLSEKHKTDMLVSFHTYGKGATGVGIIVGDKDKTGTIMETSKGKILRLPRPEFEDVLAQQIIKEFQKSWIMPREDKEIIVEDRDTKLKDLGLFAQQKIQKPTFIIELGSIKTKDNDFVHKNLNEIAEAAAEGILDALIENAMINNLVRTL
ncbi:MAG: N-acetylmuramoyl-L-alanine amidase [Christensenellaceae bacterium]|jgi:N-acetylmuramoyl-L-alanine amidase|nr:N-acetylmuramoyl-L-alanine amidase [Christensenellaceae bacterium]